MIARYTQEKMDTERSLPKTALGEQRCLTEFFGPCVEQDLAVVTPRRAAMLYEHATVRISRKTGQPLSAASHRAYLEYAKTSTAERKSSSGQGASAARRAASPLP